MSPQNFLILFLTLFILEEAWQFILSAKNLRWITARSKTVPDYLQGHVSQEELESAAQYSAAKTKIENWSTLLDSSLLIVFILFGLFAALDSCFVGVENSYWRTALFFGTLMAAQQVVGTPFEYYGTFVVEERFGFNKTTPKLYWVDWIKGFVINLLLSIPLLMVLVWFLSTYEWWWLYSWLFITGYMLLMTVAYPRIIAPLFNKFNPLEPGGLSDELAKLMDKCGFTLQEVKVMDASRRSSHSNAYFTGFGKAKRIVLFDTLIEKLGEQEIVSVLAHELGHFKKRHVLKTFFLMQSMALVGLYLLDFIVHQDFIYAGLGLNQNAWSALVAFGIIVPVASFWMGPLFSWISRRNEYEADAFARDVVGTDQHLSSALISLGKENLSSPEPHPLFVMWHHSHPPVGERIRAMRSNSQ